MKINEIRSKNEKELKGLLLKAKETLRQLRFDHSVGKLKNVDEIRDTKKLKSKILTILNGKKLGSEEK